MSIKIFYSAGVFLFLYSLLLFRNLVEKHTAQGKVLEISSLIKSAAHVYLRKQFSIVWILAMIISCLLYFSMNIVVASSFLIGVIVSTIICFFNMELSLTANNRVIASIEKKGVGEGFKTAVWAGAAASVMLPSLCIIVILNSFLFINYKLLNSFFLGISLGVSLVSMFARLGGGIFTKGADMGADLVGKVEQNLPEDDIRNPAVIADNVGDNVGDCSGTSADLVESYMITLLCLVGEPSQFLVSILVALIGVISCSIPIFFMSFKNVWKDIHRYFLTSIFTFMMSIMLLFYNGFIEKQTSICIILGALCVGILLKITEYYTSSDFGPVKQVANASYSGAGTNIIYGLSLSYEATVMPIIVIFAILLICFNQYGLSGIAYCALGAISLTPAIITLDVFGPISDNAGGIAEMAQCSQDTIDATEVLDKAGNTTKALTKGFSIFSSIFTSIMMTYKLLDTFDKIPYFKSSPMSNITNIFSINNLCGLFIGAIIPNLFISISLKSVGYAALEVVKDIRNQLKEFPGILDGTIAPNYNRTINVLTDISIKEMILPVLIPILIFIGSFFLYKHTHINSTISSINLLLYMNVGVTVTSVLTGMSMCIAGGAWDNAKKYIESGPDGKNSLAHKASVIGDTVGDPYKDTVGPALSSLCKMVNLITIVMVNFFIK